MSRFFKEACPKGLLCVEKMRLSEWIFNLSWRPSGEYATFPVRCNSPVKEGIINTNGEGSTYILPERTNWWEGVLDNFKGRLENIAPKKLYLRKLSPVIHAIKMPKIIMSLVGEREGFISLQIRNKILIIG